MKVLLVLASCSGGETGGVAHARPQAVDSGTEAVESDTASPDPDTEPASLAGTYAPVQLEQLVVSGSVRSSALTWNGTRWIDVYVGVTDRFHVYAVALDPGTTGVVAGAPVQLDDGGYDGFEAEIATADDGTSLAVFEDDRVGEGNCCREIRARRLDLAGQPLGASFNLTDNPTVEEYTPAVAWDGDTWFVAWSDDRDYAGDDRRYLYGRTVGPDESQGEQVLLGGDSYWQTWAEVEGSGGAGFFLVVWGDYDLVGPALDCGYRARIVDTSGAPVTGVLDLARIGEAVYDRPGVAWNPWREAWLVTWMSPYTIHGSWVHPDGTVEDLGTLVAPDEGAGSARLTYSPVTNSFLLAYHAWWTYDGWVQELDTDGVPVGERREINAATPPLGTFYVPIVAREDAAEALAAPSLDYTRITASLYRSQ